MSYDRSTGFILLTQSCRYNGESEFLKLILLQSSMLTPGACYSTPLLNISACYLNFFKFHVNIYT